MKFLRLLFLGLPSTLIGILLADTCSAQTESDPLVSRMYVNSRVQTAQDAATANATRISSLTAQVATLQTAVNSLSAAVTALQSGTTTGGGSGTATQPASYTTVLLVDAAGGTIGDRIATPHSLTLSGGVTNATNITAPGYAQSIRFDGSAMRISTAQIGSEFTFGAGDFTFEAKVYLTALPSGSFAALIARGGNTGSDSWLWNIPQGGAGQDFNVKNSSNVWINTGPTSTTPQLTTGVWYDLAVIRVAGVTRSYVNGVVSGTSSSSPSLESNNLGLPITLGAFNPGGANVWNGYAAAFRMSKGNRYNVSGTASYTPNAVFSP